MMMKVQEHKCRKKFSQCRNAIAHNSASIKREINDVAIGGHALCLVASIKRQLFQYFRNNGCTFWQLIKDRPWSRRRNDAAMSHILTSRNQAMSYSSDEVIHVLWSQSFSQRLTINDFWSNSIYNPEQFSNATSAVSVYYLAADVRTGLRTTCTIIIIIIITLTISNAP